MKKKFLQPIVLLFFLCFTTSAWAEQAEPEEKVAETQQVIPNIGTGIIYQNSVFFRSNPAGLGEGLTAGYKKKLWDKPSDDLLFGTSYVFVGFDLITVGIANALEAAVSIEPIALLYFRASYGTLFTSRDGNPESLYNIDFLTGSTKALARLAGSSLTQSSNLKL